MGQCGCEANAISQRPEGFCNSTAVPAPLSQHVRMCRTCQRRCRGAPLRGKASASDAVLSEATHRAPRQIRAPLHDDVGARDFT
jgi:hypothetical protein